MNLKSVMQAIGLTDEEREKLGELLGVWEAKLIRNKLRTQYYDAKNGLKNLGIAIPEKLESIDSVVGWPAKAVDGLQSRSIFDGFIYDKDKVSGIDEIVAENRMLLGYEQAVRSELVNSCVFCTLSKGELDEPDVVINFHTAEMSSALWNYRKKRIDYGMVVIDIKRKPKSRYVEPVWINLYTDTAIMEIKKDEQMTAWRVERKPQKMGRLLMEVLAYRPSLKRPFGKSRISRAVMSITDNAVRACLRAELGSEFYTTPQKYLLGADEEDFDRPKWDAYIGSIFVAGKDEDGDVPKYGQLPQATMQPHIEYMRNLAAQFSGETSIPISSLGVIHDNPASAEAIYAAKEDLVIEAQSLNRLNGDALKVIMQMALCIKQDKAFKDLEPEEHAIMPHFKNPAMPSLVSQADAMVKLSAAAPWLPETEVFFEEVGFDDSTRTRLMSEKKKLQAQIDLSAQMQNVLTANGREKPATMYEISSIIKSFRAGKITEDNAITLFERVGIEAAEAKQILADARKDAIVFDGSGSSDEATSKAGGTESSKPKARTKVGPTSATKTI